jgi:transposase
LHKGIATWGRSREGTPLPAKERRLVWFDPGLYKNRSAIEWFFSWIGVFKGIAPHYEQYEQSFMGLIHLAWSIMTGKYWDNLEV